MNFTSEQQSVITSRDHNLLVSAAAGSGKTAVLVERIIGRVLEEEKPTDIDRMLVMTFTEAAAGEMKERIGRVIEERLYLQPNNRHLQKQALLIHSAPITTIHGFCLNVIRNHFHEIGIDPGFRVADEGECKLLKADVTEKVLEAAYEKAEEDFIYMAECYGAGKSDTAIEELIGKLYTFSMSDPFPEEWLQGCKAAYHTEGITKIEDFVWAKDIIHNIESILTDLKEQIEVLLKICTEPQGPYMYEKAVLSDAERIEELIQCKTYAEYREGFTQLSFETLGRVKATEGIDPVKKELAKSLRDDYKKALARVKEQYFAETPEQLLKDMKISGGAVNALINLTCEFTEAYDSAKRDKNIIDFDDMEHMALRILLKKENGELVPTKTAIEYRDYFTEILVDEYQDSNLVQEYLIKAISREPIREYNVFMVGDVKQSIYRFRLARPELFMEKYRTYPTEGCEKIDLHKNFRSKANVLATVNDIFTQIMREQIGGIEYNADARLNYGADYFEEAEHHSMDESELLIVERKSENDIITTDIESDDLPDKKEAEAKAIANRIRRFVSEEKIWDKKEKKERPVTYADIVILLRTNKGYDEIFKKILEEAGIPVHITSKTGYFATTEIEILLDFLRILDNPLQDIAMAASMKSIFGGFSDEELAVIRCASKKRLLFEAVCEYAESEQQATDVLKDKALHFLDMLQYYRDKVPYTSVYYLMNELIRRTGYLYHVSASPTGQQRKANVNMLLEKANDYGKTSYKGLFHFVRYIEYLQKYDVDYGEVNLASENDNAVRIMSIHKSKGLEFPICIIAAASKQINFQDARQAVVLDADYGPGVDCIDPEKRLKSATLLKKVIQNKAKTDTLAEELRVLYVALTRAEQKIVITGCVDDFAKKLQRYCKILNSNHMQLTPTTISSFSSFFDMIVCSIIRHPCMQQILAEYGMPVSESVLPFQSEIKVSVVTIQDMVETQMQESMAQEILKERLLLNNKSTLLEEVEKRFSYTYPYVTDRSARVKVSVSELKKRHMAEEAEDGEILFVEEEVVPYIPRFAGKEEIVSSVQKGTAYHKLLELMDYEIDISALNEHFASLCQKGYIAQELLDVVKIEEMVAFRASALAKRMERAAKCGKLYREQPFVLGDAEEDVLVQGIIDAYFEEDDELVVVDYKTDRVSVEADLVNRYQIQLSYYAKALEQIMQKPVKQKIIYAFGLEREIVLS